MRKTNTLMRCGTATFILAAIGITTPILSTASAEPILAAVQDSLNDVIQPINEVKVDKPLIVEVERPTVIKQAQATQVVRPTNASLSQSPSLKPMRLRMRLNVTLDEIKRVEKFKQAWIDGDKDADRHLKFTTPDKVYKRMFQVSVSDAGAATLTVSRQGVGWPRIPQSNYFVFDTRELSTDMRRGMKNIMDKCSSYSAPIYFEGNMFEGDTDLAKGTFEVECLPGREAARNRVSDVELANVFLKSEGLPLEKRQSNFQWMIHFAMMRDYVKKTPNATFATDRAACVRMHTEHKAKYSFNEGQRKIQDEFLSKCSEADYNWVRKGVGIAEVTQ